MGALAKTPQADNWLEKLPKSMQVAFGKSIIYRCALHLHREKGYPAGRAIATAISWCRSTVASQDIKNWPGKQNVNPGSLAQMAAALALWSEMKSYARSHKG